jgi:hypothetical protein
MFEFLARKGSGNTMPTPQLLSYPLRVPDSLSNQDAFLSNGGSASSSGVNAGGRSAAFGQVIPRAG